MTRHELISALKESVAALEAQEKDDKVMLEQLCVLDGQWGTWACPGYGGTCSTLFRIKQNEWRPYNEDELFWFVKDRLEFRTFNGDTRRIEQIWFSHEKQYCRITDSCGKHWSPEGLLRCHWPDGSKMGVRI